MYLQRLKDLREDKDLLQKDIAEKIGTTSNYYGDYEKGKRPIPIYRLLILAEFYNVSLDYITGRTNDKEGLTKSDMSQEETDLIKKYRSLSEKRQGILLGTLNTLTGEQEEETAQDRDVI